METNEFSTAFDDEIRYSLAKDPQHRSFDDLLHLRHFILTIPCIKKLFEKITALDPLNDFCKKIGLESFNENDIVYNQGDYPANKLYVVITGGCCLKLRYRIDLRKDVFEEREKTIAKLSAVGDKFGAENFDVDRWTSSAVCTHDSTFLLAIPTDMLQPVDVSSISSSLLSSRRDPGSRDFFLNFFSIRKEYRAVDDIEIVAKHLKSNIRFFSSFTSGQLQELCRVTEALTISHRNILFHQGDIGQAFYVIMGGTVEIRKREEGDAPNPELDQWYCTGSDRLAAECGKPVNVLHKGDSFGEKALESYSKRAASVLTFDHQETDLLVVYKEDYKMVLAMTKHKEMADKIALLRRTSLFKDAEVFHLYALAKCMQLKEFRIDEVLYRFGEKATQMFLIDSGEARVEIPIGTATRLKGNAEKDEDVVRTMNLGRLGPGSVMSAYAIQQLGGEDAYHSETVIASSLVWAFYVIKKDFLLNIPEDVQSVLRAKIIVSLDFQLTKVGGNESLRTQAWRRFNLDVVNRKKNADILQCYREVCSVNERGGEPDQTVLHSRANEPFHEAGEVGIAKSKDNTGRKDVKFSDVPGVGLVSPTGNIILMSNIVEEEPVVVAAFARNLRRERVKQNELIVEVGPSALRELKSRRSFRAGVSSKDSANLLSELTSSLKSNNFTSSTKLDDAHADQHDTEGGVLALPFSLVHIHRERNLDGDRRLIKCFLRLGGSCATVSRAKALAQKQADHILITYTKDIAGKNRLPKDDFEHCSTNHDIRTGLLLDWKVITSFEHIDLLESDFFLIYCRNIPLEYASFSTKIDNFMLYPFPAEAKLRGQRFACVRFSKLSSTAHESNIHNIDHPKYLEELSVLDEIIASGFSIASCLHHILTDTPEGHLMRVQHIPKLLTSYDVPTSKNNSCASRSVEASLPMSDDDSFLDVSVLGPHRNKRICLVPLYQWVRIAEEKLASMDVEHLVFQSSTQAIDGIEENFQQTFTNVSKNLKRCGLVTTRKDSMGDENEAQSLQHIERISKTVEKELREIEFREELKMRMVHIKPTIVAGQSVKNLIAAAAECQRDASVKKNVKRAMKYTDSEVSSRLARDQDSESGTNGTVGDSVSQVFRVTSQDKYENMQKMIALRQKIIAQNDDICRQDALVSSSTNVIFNAGSSFLPSKSHRVAVVESRSTTGQHMTASGGRIKLAPMHDHMHLLEALQGLPLSGHNVKTSSMSLQYKKESSTFRSIASLDKSVNEKNDYKSDGNLQSAAIIRTVGIRQKLDFLSSIITNRDYNP